MSYSHVGFRELMDTNKKLEAENALLKELWEGLNRPCLMNESPCGKCENCQFTSEYFKGKEALEKDKSNV